MRLVIRIVRARVVAPLISVLFTAEDLGGTAHGLDERAEDVDKAVGKQGRQAGPDDPAPDAAFPISRRTAVRRDPASRARQPGEKAPAEERGDEQVVGDLRASDNAQADHARGEVEVPATGRVEGDAVDDVGTRDEAGDECLRGRVVSTRRDFAGLWKVGKTEHRTLTARRESRMPSPATRADSPVDVPEGPARAPICRGTLRSRRPQTQP